MDGLGSILLNEGSFAEILMGNSAVVRAMLESGVDVITSYPGSPTPEIGDAIASVLSIAEPFYFEYSTNEKVAAELAFGAAVNGKTAAVFFKSVGLNVASDSVVQFSLMEPSGGIVIILGDDPGANSSQNEQDNRHFARMADIPIYEPANPDQAYRMFLEAVGVSREFRIPVMIRMTTHVCHAKELIQFGEYKMRKPEITSGFRPVEGEFIPLTKAVHPMKERAIGKLRRIRERAELSGFNRIINNGSRRGIVTCGLPSLSVYEIISELDAGPDVLTICMPWPLPVSLIMDFCRRHDEILIVEELDDFIEKEVKAAAYDHGLSTKIRGKTEAADYIGELTPANMRRFLSSKWPDINPPQVSPVSFSPQNPRPAQMCPGCGHRSAFYAIKKALSSDDITVADIGCHTLGFMEPYRIGQILLSMGHSNGTGAGLSLYSDRRVVTFLGDSTFFHAGLPGIINAARYNHDITLIIMENGTTAMTGHQDHAGSKSQRGAERKPIKIRSVLDALGAASVQEVDTYNQVKLTEAVRSAMNIRGFSVVIARHPCMLKLTRENRRRGKLPARKAAIDASVCERKLECIESFCCPSFTVDGASGEIGVNPELCIGDGSCIQVCPAEAVSLRNKEGGDE